MASANVHVGEGDFEAVAAAAYAARDAGDTVQAAALDKLARKINAALGTAAGKGLMPGLPSPGVKGLSWRDVPSVFDVGAHA